MPTDSLANTETLDNNATPSTGATSYLLVVEGTSSYKRALPWDGVLLVGRVGEADVQIDAGSISRRHAKFIVSRGEVQVADLGSHNGTRVNGELVTGTRTLSSGDVVTMGEVAFVLWRDRPPPTLRVANVEALRQRLEDEVERALDHGRTLSILFFSLGAGVSNVEDAGSALLSCLGRSDALGWAGPGQLVVLLPERSVKAAQEEGMLLLAAAAEEAPRVRGGLALCPHDGCDADTLLSGARAAAEIAPVRGLGMAGAAAVEHVLGDRHIVIADPAMIQLFDLIRRLAQTDLTVLIQGEMGTGKENAALALHHWSGRAKRPLVTLNCAALPEGLVESELFGYERGAHSEARFAKPGLLEAANGGTMFLDEIGELSLPVQAKLLRALEEKRVTRLGDVREREVNIRIVAATNRDLEEECRAKRFREDLWFRIVANPVKLPPLRERPREIAILARRFLAETCEQQLKQPGAELSEAAMQKLAAYTWPGNVRELKNAMEYAAVRMGGERVELWDLPDRVRRANEPGVGAPAAAFATTEPPSAADSEAPRTERSSKDPAARVEEPPAPRQLPLAEELKRLERARITEALEATGGVKAHAAELLGMPIRTFMYKLKQYGMTAKGKP